jgi:site-specific recombinase XerD
MPDIELYEPAVEAEIVEDSTTPGATVVPMSSAVPHVELHPETAAIIETGKSAQTRRQYGADREAYAEWCEREGVQAVPAHPNTLANYMRHQMTIPRGKDGRKTSVSLLERSLSSILTWHEEQEYPKPITKPARAVINAYKKWLAENKDAAATPKRAAPAVPDKLRAMLAEVDRTTLKGKRDAALLLIGFAIAGRASELEPCDINSFERTADGLDTTVYRRKVKVHTENVILYGSDPNTCPVRAYDAYVEALKEVGRTEGPLFIRIDRHGRVAPPMYRRGVPIGDPEGRMTAEAIADVVTALAEGAGFAGKWTAHSLRRGFATAARKAGHDLVRIGRTGGWADGSKSLLKYLEDVDRVKESPLVGIGL